MMKLNEYSKLNHTEVKILKAKNQPKDYEIQYSVPMEYIPSFQINFNNETMKITQDIMIDDQSLVNALVNFRYSIIEITYTDLFGDSTVKRFCITNVNHIRYGQDNKAYEIMLQDEASWYLENSYLGKSYKSGDMVNVLNDFLKHLEVEYLIEGSLPFNTPLVVPKHINNLKFFEDEIYRMGQSIQGTRNGQKIFKEEEIRYDLLSMDDIFLEKEPNEKYKNAIIDFNTKELTRNDVNPEFETFDFKNENNDFIKDDSYVLQLQVNDRKESVLDTTGKKSIYQRITKHKEMVKRDSLRHNGIDIVVKGYCYREVNTIQDIFIEGNKLDNRFIDLGDTVNSGKYIVCQIQDRFISGSLVQKLFLRRPDTGDVLNPEEV